jgi:hypothetical protein
MGWPGLRPEEGRIESVKRAQLKRALQLIASSSPPWELISEVGLPDSGLVSANVCQSMVLVFTPDDVKINVIHVPTANLKLLLSDKGATQRGRGHMDITSERQACRIGSVKRTDRLRAAYMSAPGCMA